MEEKKWFACKAKQVRDVQVYVQAETPEEARELIESDEWDDLDVLDEDDDDEGVIEYDFDTITEVPAEEVEDDDDDDDED